MELWESGQDLLSSNVLDGHKWDKYCLDDSFVSHLRARIPCGGHCSLPGRWKEAGDDIISMAHRNRCILLIGVQMFFFSSLFIYFILEQGEMGRRSMADRKRYSVTVNKRHASLLYWRCINLKEKDVASSSLHQRSFYSKTQNNMKSATTGVFKLWCQWPLLYKREKILK